MKATSLLTLCFNFYDKILLMKFRILISIFFLIATTLSALHELEHITQESDSASCMVYHINDKLTPIDIIDNEKYIEFFNFENITQNNQIFNTHFKNKSNPNRAPPLIS